MNKKSILPATEITGNQIEIINFVVDIFNHRDYDKVFGYKH